MKLKIIMTILNSYLEETEILRLGKKITDVVKLKPITGIEPPTSLGLIIISPKGVEQRVVFKKVPKFWKAHGYAWKLDIDWFKREYSKLSVKNLFGNIKEKLWL